MTIETVAYVGVMALFILAFITWWGFVEHVSKKMEWDQFASGAIMVVVFNLILRVVFR